jgi:lysozyme
MKVNQATIDLIKRWESFVDHVYLCAAGYRTIGFGHLVGQSEQFSTISIEEAEELLQKDLIFAINGVARNIKVPLTDNQFGALVSFAFNLGSGCLQRSTLRQRLNRSDFDVENEFMKYVYAGGKKLKGLIRRRQAEANLFRS